MKLFLTAACFLSGINCAAAPSRVVLLPASVTLYGPHACQRLLVEQLSGGAAIGPASQNIKFTSSNLHVAVVSPAGMVTPEGDGVCKITARNGGATIATIVRVVGFKSQRTWSFRNDVLPVLTKAGCNGGSCHGAAAGKGGLKLSLRGFDPDADYEMFTHQADGRRVVPGSPEQSLMLLKPTMRMGHGGGIRVIRGSREEAAIAGWIAEGATPPGSGDKHIEALEVAPPVARLHPGEQQQLIVTARYSDGTSRDVTSLVKFGSVDGAVGTVDDSGLVHVPGRGETAVTVWYASKVNYARIVSPYPGVSAVPSSAIQSTIDRLVNSKLAELNLPASPRCSDSDFLRRASLDATGSLPTPQDTSKYLAGGSPDKRAKLVDTLLASPQYVDYWSYKWSDLLLLNSRNMPAESLNSFYSYIHSSVAQDKPWDKFVREIITARGSTVDNGAAAFFVIHKDPFDLVETTTQAFMGLSLMCAHCHNHPMEKWTQRDYYQMANLYARVKCKNGDKPGDVLVLSADSGDIPHPRLGTPLAPKTLDGVELRPDDPVDRRVRLADWITSRSNNAFAASIVNRVWASIMGRGIVEAVDDLRATNPPTNQPLMDALSSEFVSSGYDIKKLIRKILLSDTYQRSSDPLGANSADNRNFSHYIVRRLPAEPLLDAIAAVTGVPTTYKDLPKGTRAIELKDNQVESYFLTTFGRPLREKTCECERQQAPDVAQALQLSNGDVINARLKTAGGVIDGLLKRNASDAEALQSLYLAALCRYPSPEEERTALSILAPISPGGPSGGKNRQTRLAELHWKISTGLCLPAVNLSSITDMMVIRWITSTCVLFCAFCALAVSAGSSPAITALAYNPGGSLLATGRYAEVSWRAGTGMHVFKLSGHLGSVNALAFSLDGSLLAAGGGFAGRSGEVDIWSVPSGRLTARLIGPADVVQCIAWRPGKPELVGGSYDHNVYVWSVPAAPGNVARVPPLKRLRDHTDAVYGVAFSPDGAHIASAAGDRTVKIWEAGTGKRLLTLSESTGELYSVAYSPDGRLITAAGADRTIRMWSAYDGSLVRSVFAHDGPVLRLAWTGNCLISCAQDRSVKQWDPRSLAPVGEYPRQAEWPQAMAVSSDTVAVGCQDGSINTYAILRSAGASQGATDHVSAAAPVGKSVLVTYHVTGRSAGDAVVTRETGNETAAQAQPVPVPVTITGELWEGKPGPAADSDAHYYRFAAHRDEPLVIDVMARRAGSPLDSFIQILDGSGNPVERAVLRSVGQSEITLFDKDSVTTGIRLLPFPDLQLNDYVLIGRELLRVAALPKGPDDDTQFRSIQGQRVGYLGTNPEYHSIGTKVYRVVVNAAGPVQAPYGFPFTHIAYENDDGGPLYGRDSYLMFAPPRDGDYIVRICDSRGQQGKGYTYKLNIHPPRPDYKLSINPSNITVPDGGAETATVECDRFDDFDGPIHVKLEGAGFTSTETDIEAGENSASILIAIAASTAMPAVFRVTGSAQIGGKEVVRSIEPDITRKIAVGKVPGVMVSTDVHDVTLGPGVQAAINVAIVRGKSYKGRVPIDVRNLPFGVKVMDIGLNGILVTESETSRRIVLTCEPWVKPQDRPIYVYASVEGGVGTAAAPVELHISGAK